MPPKDLPARGLRIGFPPLRFLEESFRLLAARLRGLRIFYIHYSYTGALAAALVVRLFGGASYYWNCSVYKAFRPERNAPWGDRLRYRWNTLLLETAVRWSTHLVTGTPRMARYYAEQAGIPLESIRILPNFIDLARFHSAGREEARARLDLDSSRPVVLFLHRIAPRKGAHHLPEILRRLEREVGALTLLVAGDGPYLPELKRRLAGGGFSSRIDFRHWVPNTDAPLYFAAADLYIMPSVEEGFPRVLLEAMASGCPFVAFDVGGVRDVLSGPLQDCVVEAGDLEAFAAVCVRALRSEELRNGWRDRGADRVKLFSEENAAEQFDRMLREEGRETTPFFSEGGMA
jgi:glycosyltransferase involved in cell wall biosynthesis